MPVSDWTTEESQDGIRLRGGNSTSEPLGQSDSGSGTDEEEEVSIGDLSRLADGVTESQTKYMRQLSQRGTVVNIPGTANNTRDSSDRQALVVELTKEDDCGIGLTIVGGESTGSLDLGIFVQSVLPGGPAERDGRIHTGDRVIAINGQSLEGVHHHAAIDLIRKSPPIVQLVLTQTKMPVPTEAHSEAISRNIRRIDRERFHSPTEGVNHIEMEETKRMIASFRPASPANSSDLDLENIIPEEALHTQYINRHMNPHTSTPKHEIAGNPTEDLRPGDKYDVILEKKNCSLGFNVTGGINTSVKFGGIYVKSLQENGAAEADGTIQIGDRVLEVEDVNLIGVTHKHAVETLRSAPDTCRLLMERGVPPVPVPQHHSIISPSLSSEAEDTATSKPNGSEGSDIDTSSPSHSPVGSQTVEPPYFFVTKENSSLVKLHKGSSGLGFSVAGGTDADTDLLKRIVRIKQIFPASPASHSGELRVGDVILQINGQRIDGLKRCEVMTMLRTESHDVELLICRPEPGILPALPTPLQQPTTITDTQPPLHHITPLETPVSTPKHHKQERQLYSGSEVNKCNTETTLERTQDCNSVGQSDQESISRLNTVKRKVMALEAGMSPHNNDKDIAKKEPMSDTEIEQLPLSRHSSLENSSVPSPVGECTNALAHSESEMNLTAASEHDHLQSTEMGEDENSEITPTHAESNDQSGWASSELESATKADYTTSYYSDEETVFTSGEFEVTLTKGPKGLGFTVAGGQTSTGFFYVKDILFEPALSEESIQRGDRILMVNGKDMTDLNHTEAIAYLRQTPATVNILFSRSAVFMNQQASEVRAHEVEGSSEVTSTRKDETTTSNDGQSLDDMHLLLPKKETFAKTQNQNNVNEKEDNKNRSDLCQSPKKDVIRVDLKKPPGSNLGLSLIQGEKCNTSALLVRNLTPDGIAAIDGRLKVGDRLLQVNGESVIGMAHNKAVALIKNASNLVSLVISRNQSTSISGLTLNSSQCNTDSDVDSISLDEEDNSVVDESTKQNQNDAIAAGGNIIKGGQSSQAVSKNCDRDANTIKSERDCSDLNVLLSEREGKSPIYQPSSFDNKDKEPNKNNEEQSKQPILARKPVQSQVPQEVSDSWLRSLKLIDVPKDSLHYLGRELVATLKELEQKMERDDPTEEYKNMKFTKPTDNSFDARLPENRNKNRYRNVLPYDSTRVRLSGPDNYINANHIHVAVGKQQKQYIACQGPLPQTTDDFWRMIWEQNVEVIAMVTQDTESGKVKCNRYWPDSIGTPFTVYNRYELCLVRLHKLDHFDIRYVNMKDLDTGKVRPIVHCNYTSWPDHGTPSTGIPLLQYIKFISLTQEASTGPLVVHCSAGIGRTGTLITLDVLMTMIAKDTKFDIKKVVMDLRRQRQGMIQTKDQYIFCYKTILEALHLIKS